MEKMPSENHYTMRSAWLRAAVLGANDGILSTASIIIGVAAASSTREPILLSGVAGLVAGALSMAAGEYVSVSSQTDLEKADLAREIQELRDTPHAEMLELAAIYEHRGLEPATALEVAKQLTAHDALGAHARDELGISALTVARPLQAALSSGIAFTIGGSLPVLVAVVSPVKNMELIQYGCAIIFLAALGVTAAKTGGSKPLVAVARITFWGTLAMGITAGIGYLFNLNMV